jgi:hypothetical protein
MMISVSPSLESSDSSSAPHAKTSNYHRTMESLDEAEAKIAGSGWDMLELEEQGEFMYAITRLYGQDPFTTSAICDRIDRESHCY